MKSHRQTIRWNKLIRLAFSLCLTATVLPVGPVQAAFPGANGKLVFTHNNDIYKMNADGSLLTQLTSGTANDFDPVWSPDGAKIAFWSDRDSAYEIYVMNADGSSLTRLTNDGYSDIEPTWSPDGTQIAFASNRDGLITSIYVINADGSNVTRVTNQYPASDSAPAWSPDGARIAFESNQARDLEIYSVNVDGSQRTRLTNSSGIDRHAAWSPDGAQLIFESQRSPDIDFEVFVMNADGSGQVSLTSNSIDDAQPAWSPDGARVAFERNLNGHTEIFVMNTDGSGQTNITNSPGSDDHPDWQSVSGPPVMVDTIAPMTTAILFPLANSAGWHNGPVTLELNASDNAGGSGVQSMTFSASGAQSLSSVTVAGATTTIVGFVDGTTTLTFSARDNAGNVEVANYVTIRLDSTPPVVSVTGIQAGTIYASGAVPAAACQTTDALSGVAMPATANLSGGNTSGVGEFTASCIGAADTAGNTGSATATYTVIYPFGGFMSPVNDLPTLNRVSAGRAVPVKFSLNGNRGLDIASIGYPKSQVVPCDATAPVDGIEETVTAGASSLSYDASTDQYTYVWKSEKAWAGTCRQLVIQLNDGASYRANFQFSK